MSAIAVVGFVPAYAMPAEQLQSPALEEILDRLEHNLDEYNSTVPSFFCIEHVVSSVFPGSLQKTITESVFRLKRVPQSNRTSTLEESRTVRTVNGKPATSEELEGPVVLSGAFGGSLDIVSLSQKSCMNYKLERIRTTSHPAPYIIRFTTKSRPPQPADCLLQESARGQAFIDPVSLQIKRLELTTPRHILSYDGDSDLGHAPEKGERKLSIDFAPVQLGNRTFWMPISITSRIAAGANTFHPIIWSFDALYRDYHKIEVTTRIIPVE